MKRQDILAVIPAYQCAPTVGEVVEGLKRYVDRVFVLDDGSTDGSGDVARQAGAEVHRFDANQGKGAALIHCVRLALEAVPDAVAVALVDGDGQHDPDDLPAFLEARDRDGTDLLVGARLKDREAIPAHRYWANTIGSRLLSWVSGVDLEDSQSGYRLISADLWRRLGLSSKGYAIESEMLLKSARRGASIEHVRVRTIYHDRVPSHFRPVLDTARIFCASAYHRVFDRVR